ncbi:MAG: DUF1800 domain-containing protein [Actinomycetota bacterium]
MSTPEVREQVAHVLRRVGFGPRPGSVESWEQEGAGALIEALLDDERIEFRTEENLFDGLAMPGEDDGDYGFFVDVVSTMLNGLAHGENPLHERMTWYWHTHLTSSYDRASGSMIWRQHQLVRRHSLGHFPTLIRQITTDPAMLFYLDGAGSRGANPNENYARELLELFTLGRNGGYGEDDVRAAARILSGWWVDWETEEVHFEPEETYSRPVTFMGERRRWDLDSFIDFVCNQPACAEHVATRLYHHLVGPDLSDRRRRELAAVFVDAGLEIRPLVAAILRGPDFLEARRSRARQPVEWLIAARSVAGFHEVLGEYGEWWLDVLGQIPFVPPNVAGWPLDDRWSSASQVISRTSVLFDWELPDTVVDELEPTVDAVLARCGIHTPSPSTLQALKQIEADVSEYDGRLDLLLATALVSPEFTLL